MKDRKNGIGEKSMQGIQSQKKQREKMPSSRDFLTIVFKHKLAIIVLFLIIFSVVTAMTYVRPFMYESTSKILVKFERDDVPLTTSTPAPSSVMTMRSAEEDIRTEMEIINNKDLIREVVEVLWEDLNRSGKAEPTSLWGKTKRVITSSLGAVKDMVYEVGYKFDIMRRLTNFESKVKEVQDSLTIDVIGDSNVIAVTYSSWNPELCPKVVNTLTEKYLQRHIEVHETPRAQSFFDSQKEYWEQRLTENENELKNFKDQYSISSIELQRGYLLDNISETMMAHDRLQSEIEDAEKRLDSLNSQITLRTNYRNPATVSPAVLSEDVISQNLVNERLITETELKGLLAKDALYQKQLDNYRTELLALDEKETMLQRMTRDMSLSENNYKLYFEKVEDSRISKALDVENISNVTIIEPALVPFEPVRVIPFLPTRLLHILAGIIIGLMVGIGYAFLVEQMDHTFGSREEVEEILGVPCLVSIPKQ